MNFPAQGLQSTCPQGTVITALIVLLSTLSQAGHISVGPSVDVVFESLAVVKFTVIRVLRESGCGSFEEEAGQVGDSFWDLVGIEGWVEEERVEGVWEGTQKEGRVGFAAWGLLASFFRKVYILGVGAGIPSLHPAPS